MFQITAQYIRKELADIVRIINSNYQELLHKGPTNKIRNTLDDSPVDWNLSFSWVNNRKVKDLNDLDEKDWTQEHTNRDRLKNIAIEGKTKDTDVDIMFKVIWGESEGQNKYIIYQKAGNEWDKGHTEYNLKNAFKFIEKLNNPELDISNNSQIYKNILDKKRNEIKEYLNSLLDIKYPWKLSPRSPAKKYSLEFTIPDMTKEDNDSLMKKIQDSKIDEKLVNFISELAIKDGFKKEEFNLMPSFKKSLGFSILLK